MHEPQSAPALTTNELAAELKVKPQTIRKRLSSTGTYYGLRPFWLKNGRLRWPADAVGRLIQERS